MIDFIDLFAEQVTYIEILDKELQKLYKKKV